MSTPNTGGPAFPCDLTAYDEEVVKEFQGMTLRDYFAAVAMQGWQANSAGSIATMDQVAVWAYAVADAMLKARAQK